MTDAEAPSSPVEASEQVPAPDTPDGPWWTLSEAAERCRVSRSSIRRLLDADKLPNARRDDGPKGPGTGPWLIPMGDLLANDVHPSMLGAGPPPNRAEQVGQADEMSELRAEVAELRTRAAVAEALAAERERTIEALRDALAKLPPALANTPDGPPLSQPPVREPAPESVGTDPAPRRRWWQRIR